MLVVLMILWAQQTADSYSGGAGWLGTGLIGVVLAWLLFVHLPGKDKLHKEQMDTKDLQHAVQSEAKDKAMRDFTEANTRQCTALTEAFRLEGRESRGEFKAALDKVASHCAEEMNRLTEAVKVELRAHQTREKRQG